MRSIRRGTHPNERHQPGYAARTEGIKLRLEAQHLAVDRSPGQQIDVFSTAEHSGGSVEGFEIIELGDEVIDLGRGGSVAEHIQVCKSNLLPDLILWAATKTEFNHLLNVNGYCQRT